jgi:hypothetical protein
MKKSPSIDAAVESFADAARRYCSWAEGSLGDSLEEIQRARLLLTELHLAAVKLPDIGVGEEVEGNEVSSDAWQAMFQKLGSLPVNGYWDVFDPLKEDEKEPVFNSLADDLADIYRDIKDGLSLFDAGHIVEAVWEWRFSFRTHWGQHLTGAHRALHSYLQYEEF